MDGVRETKEGRASTLQSPVVLSNSLGWPGLTSEPQLLSLGLEQASLVLVLKGLFAEIQGSAIQGEAWACLGPLVPLLTQKSHPRDALALAKMGHGGLLTLGFVF